MFFLLNMLADITETQFDDELIAKLEAAFSIEEIQEDFKDLVLALTANDQAQIKSIALKLFFAAMRAK